MQTQSKHKFPKLKDNNNGKDCSYYMNIEEKQIQRDEQTEETMFVADEYLIKKPLETITSNDIVKEVITQMFSLEMEQKLINEFNGAMIGIYSDEEKQQKVLRYKRFLEERERIKEQINTDCKEINLA